MANTEAVHMKKLKLYLETSVWNFFFADDSPEKNNNTLLLFEEIEQGKYEIYISELVLAEIYDSQPEKREKLAALIKKYSPIELKYNEEVLTLSEKYSYLNIVPARYKNDLIHIAFAVTSHMNAIVSWNLEHIVKMKTRIEVNAVNKLEMYHEIEICTPEEVI